MTIRILRMSCWSGWAQIDPVVGAPLTPNKQTNKLLEWIDHLTRPLIGTVFVERPRRSVTAEGR